MTEKRIFHRTGFRDECLVSRDGGTFEGALENISLNGALLSVGDHGAWVPGERCRLSLLLREKSPLELSAEVIHVTFGMLGVRFGPCSPVTRLRLLRLIAKISREPERLQEEMERIRQQIDTYLSPEPESGG